MTPETGTATCDAILSAVEQCERARRWHRLTRSDVDVFSRRMERAVRAGESADARAYERQVAAANEACRAAWTAYRGSVARLTHLVAGRA